MKLYKSQDEIKEKRAKDREEARKNKKPKKEAVSKKEKDALVKSPKNFLGTQYLYIPSIYKTQISYKVGKINFLKN